MARHAMADWAEACDIAARTEAAQAIGGRIVRRDVADAESVAAVASTVEFTPEQGARIPVPAAILPGDGASRGPFIGENGTPGAIPGEAGPGPSGPSAFLPNLVMPDSRPRTPMPGTLAISAGARAPHRLPGRHAPGGAAARSVALLR